MSKLPDSRPTSCCSNAMPAAWKHSLPLFPLKWQVLAKVTAQITPACNEGKAAIARRLGYQGSLCSLGREPHVLPCNRSFSPKQDCPVRDLIVVQHLQQMSHSNSQQRGWILRAPNQGLQVGHRRRCCILKAKGVAWKGKSQIGGAKPLRMWLFPGQQEYPHQMWFTGASMTLSIQWGWLVKGNWQENLTWVKVTTKRHHFGKALPPIPWTSSRPFWATCRCSRKGKRPETNL